MPIRVLGCSGSIAAQNRTTAFLIDGRILIDAGTGVGDLELEELAAIDEVLISHAHLDHVAALPLLADSVMRLRMAARKPPIRVRGLPATLDALRRHVFNHVIWPDFTALPTPQHPVLTLEPFALGERLALAGRTVEILPAEHTVPAVGFAVWPGDPHDSACWVFTGDTGPNPALWRRLAELRVAQLVIETAFSDDDHEVARRSQHLHPAALVRELAQLQQSVEILITHIKPGEDAPVMEAIAAHGVRATALRRGQRLPIGSERL